VVDPQRVNLQKARRKRLLQFFGCEDAVVNTTMALHDRLSNTPFKFKNNGFKGPRKRHFSVMSVTNSENLNFLFEDIDAMKRDFQMTSREFFKIMIRQTHKLLFFYQETMKSKKRMQVCASRPETMRMARLSTQPDSLTSRNIDSVFSYLRNLQFEEAQSDYESVQFEKDSSVNLSEEADADAEISKSKNKKESQERSEVID